MATLQKFKLLTSHCAVVNTPSPSPTASPVIHIRRRKTLRMLLRRTSTTNAADSFLRRLPDRRKSDQRPSQTTTTTTTTTSKDRLTVRLKLKDLLISSPPPPMNDIKDREGEELRRLLPVAGSSSGGDLTVGRPVGGGSGRPLSATLRQRLLMRKIWRPALVAIPELSP